MSTQETDASRGVGEQVVGDPKPLSREELLTRWEKAQYDGVVRYGAGSNTDKRGEFYKHGPGTRLVILGEDVMDSCETPWADATVEFAFEAIGRKTNIAFLERGFGMGIVASRAMEHLALRGGSYSCIELNNQVADYAENAWKPKQELRKEIAQSDMRANRPLSVEIKIIRGDAIRETQKLARKEKKFDIIISDTYPLSKDEEGINDISDLETIIGCLKPDGVFAFFGYHSGSEEDLDRTQRELVYDRFDDIQIKHVSVLPPKSYRYLNTAKGAVTRLPIIICTRPIIQES